jgi:hypothetical protein
MPELFKARVDLLALGKQDVHGLILKFSGFF